MGLGRNALLWASRSAWLRQRFPRIPTVRRAVKRFMPGEDVDSAIGAAHELNGSQIPTVFTHLGENIADLAEADAVHQHYREVIDRVARERLDTEISIKPTHLGLELDAERATENLEALVDHAREVGNRVWIDMEASPYVDATLDLYRRVRANHSNVGICLQSYLYRTADDLESLMPLGPAIRLVKGAYKEPTSVAFPKKADVDANFLALSEVLLNRLGEDGVRVAFATHDMSLIEQIRDAAHEAGVSADGYEIQMLYGIRTSDQLRLVSSGSVVRVLISYGTDWFPWYMRRLAERPANVLFVFRNLLRFG